MGKKRRRLVHLMPDVEKEKESTDLDELWDETAGTPVCPKCGAFSIYGHITEISRGKPSVDWVCEKCGYKWSNCCPFKDGVLTAIDEGEGVCARS